MLDADACRESLQMPTSDARLKCLTFRRAVLNYGMWYDFLDLDFSAVKVVFIFTTEKYSLDAQQYLERIYHAVHTYWDYVDAHELDTLALDTRQLELIWDGIA
jgi:hypothetical protein